MTKLSLSEDCAIKNEDEEEAENGKEREESQTSYAVRLLAIRVRIDT